MKFDFIRTLSCEFISITFGNSVKVRTPKPNGCLIHTIPFHLHLQGCIHLQGCHHFQGFLDLFQQLYVLGRLSLNFFCCCPYFGDSFPFWGRLLFFGCHYFSICIFWSFYSWVLIFGVNFAKHFSQLLEAYWGSFKKLSIIIMFRGI